MDTDILVIGGGIAGVSAGARLAPHARVVLVEGEGNLAYHTSGRSAALYEPNYGPGPIVELSWASEDFFRGTEGLVSPRGFMLLAREDQRALFEADCAAFDVAPMPFEAARELIPILNPDTVALAGKADHAEDIDTDRLIQGFAREIRQNGGEIWTRSPVTRITPIEGGWQVKAGGMEVTAEVILNAAGAWADQMAVLAGVGPVGLQPKRRSVARIAAPGGHDVSRWPILMGAGETWYAKPDAGALIVSPADAEPVTPHDAFAEDMVLAEGLARYQEMVTEPVTRPLANWAGLRTFAPDGVPVLGRDPAAPAFVWVAGQGGYGFQSSPAASALVADLVLGRRPGISAEAVAAMSPARFR